MRLIAELTGGLDYDRDLYCQGTDWQFGDGMGEAIMPGCVVWTPSATFPRHFEKTYTYEKAGTYEVTFSYGPLGPITTTVDVTSIELTLRAVPVTGEPLTVRLIAELTGGPDNNRALYCPGEEWQFGDGMGMATSASCIAWTPSATIRRHFEQTYTYEKAGAYEVTFTYGPLGPITTKVEVR